MNRPRYRFTFVYEYLSGDWSFCCIYADDLYDAQKQFELIPSGLCFIKYIDRNDNHYFAWEKGYEPETRVFTA